MKKPWIRAGFAAAAAIVLVPAVFGSNLAGVYVIRPLRLAFLLLGLAFAASSLESAGCIHIRSHVTQHRQAYLRLFRILVLSATAALVLAGYVFFISLGTWTHWPATTNYYDRLASAFRSGHLYVKEQPAPALVALPNPYDPDARKGIPGTQAHDPNTIWDMSLYDGRIYPYWGPTPALLLVLLNALSDIHIGDQYLNFAFLYGAFAFESLILIRLHRRFFGGVPTRLILPAILLAGLVNPIPWLLFEPRIYEAAIVAGQFFLMAGLYFAFSALDHSRVSAGRLLLSSVCCVCAVASRATLAIGVVFLALLVFLWILREGSGWRAGQEKAQAATAFAIPLLLGALLLAWYNFARFHSIFEFGYRYQLTVLDQNKYHNILLWPGYLGVNLYIYLLNAPAISEQFPFVKPMWNESFITAFENRFHSIYNTERVIGLLYVAPFLLFSLLPLVFAARRVLSGARSQEPESGRLLRWFVIALSGIGLLEMLVIFLVFYGTMRYFFDAIPTLALLAVIGFWLLYQRLDSHRIWKALYMILALVVMFFTIVMGILIGFSSDVPRLKAANPSLLTHLKLIFIVLARRVGW